MKLLRFGSLNNYFLFGLISLGTLLAACENSLESINALYLEEDFPGEYSENIELIYSDSAIIQFKLNAPVLQRYTVDSAYTEFPKGVNVIAYEDSGGVLSTMSANYAIHYENSDLIRAKSNVIIVNKYGEKLNTEEILWDKSTGKITSDAFVQITTKDEILYGDGLEANQDFSQYKIKKPKGTFQVEEDEQVQ